MLSGAMKLAGSSKGIQVTASGLSRSLASLAKNLLVAIPTEQVNAVRSRMASLTRRAISSGAPNKRSLPLMSMKASSKLSASTWGVKLSSTCMICWLTSA